MNRPYLSVEDMIGHTPLIRLDRIRKELELPAVLLAKCEFLNPGGSAKDRVALRMLCDAEERGILSPGGTVIEPTSGNTGIGLAMIGSVRGYRTLIVMPDNMSVERINTIRGFGAEVILTPAALGMAGAIEKAESLKASIPGSFIAGQFDNPANALAHYETTGPEILSDTDSVDWFVATIGTGGTLTGTGRYLKEHVPGIRIAGVEPASSPLLTEGRTGSHQIQGIGANFVPKVLDLSLPDEILTVSDKDAFFYGRLLMKTEGLMCGISSGAALAASAALARRPENADKNIVLLLPDTGTRYLSTPLFE